MRLTDVERREFNRYFKLYDFKSEIRNKTFLITGSKGLVGSGIIKWLLLENEISNTNVRIIASTRTPKDIPSYIEADDNIEFCHFGLEKQACSQLEIDYIIHSASPTGNSFHAAHPSQSLRLIIDETEKMLDICLENSNCSMIYISSEEIYGLPNTEEPLSEKYVGAIDSLNGRSCYPLGKKVAELLCYNYFLEYGIDTKIIRPTVIHGLFQKYSEERVANEILRCIIENRNLVMKSDGMTKKCIMYSLDAISAIFTVLFKGLSGEAYNATNPNTFMTVKDLANYIFNQFCPKLKVEFALKDTSVSEGYLPKRTLLQSTSKISSLGWNPITSLEQIYQVDIERFSNMSNLL